MGRFDSLTQLETKPASVSSPLDEPRNPETLKTGKPEIRKTALPESPKAEKYSTQLPPNLIKRIKQHALEQDIKDYEVVQFALEAYLSKHR